MYIFIYRYMLVQKVEKKTWVIAVQNWGKNTYTHTPHTSDLGHSAPAAEAAAGPAEEIPSASPRGEIRCKIAGRVDIYPQRLFIHVFISFFIGPHLQINLYIDGNVCVHVCISRRLDVWMCVCMHGCVRVCCVHACIYNIMVGLISANAELLHSFWVLASLALGKK